MKNSHATSLNKMFLLASFVFLSFTISSVAQTNEPQFKRIAKSESDGKIKNNETSASSNKPSNTNTPEPIVQPNYEEMSKGRVKAVAEDDNTFNKPVPVTYVGDEKNMTEVNYTIDPEQSNFENLKNMIDLRNKVHASNNHATLTQTAKYTQLLSDITTYRAKFNADVNKKGFENCTKKEQSLFLSLLKQEGKTEEYKMYSSKLKQD